MTTTRSTLAQARSARGSGTALHRYAVVVSCCTFVLILMGSMVTTTDSGLAVPDWPTTYGENMFTYAPSKWVGGIFYEHTHRLVAATVGLLTIGLCAWLWTTDQPRRLKWMGAGALIAVCLQGALGGVTVLWKLPTLVSLGHSGLAQVFFALTIAIAFMTSPNWRPGTRTDARTARLRTWCLVVMICIYLQIMLGALVRHTRSALAIKDFPTSYGHVLPPASGARLAEMIEPRLWNEPELAGVTLTNVWIHFAHRAGALIVAIAVVLLCRRVLKQFGHRRDLVTGAVLLAGLLILQIILGPVTIWTQRLLPMTTAHVGAGALMLAVSLIVVLNTFQGSRPEEQIS